MTTLLSVRPVVNRDRQIVGKAKSGDEAAVLLGELVKLRNIMWSIGEHGFQCPLIEQVWMPAFSKHDEGVCQDLSAALFAED